MVEYMKRLEIANHYFVARIEFAIEVAFVGMSATDGEPD